MIGTTEFWILLCVLAVGGGLLYRGIQQIRDVSQNNEEATMFTWVNEGGAGIVQILIGLVVIGMVLTFLPGLLGFGGGGNPVKNPTGGTSQKTGPDDALQQLVGCWEVAAEKNGQSQIVGSAISTKLGAEPWVVTQLMDVSGKLVGLIVCGFDARTATYHKYEVGIGVQSLHRVGEWVEKERAFKWHADGGKDDDSVTDTIEDTKITCLSHSPADKSVSRIWFHRTKDPIWLSPDPSPLDNLEGRWSFKSVAKVPGRDPVENSGTMILHRASGFPFFVELSFNSGSGRLADVHVTVCRNSRITKRWFSNEGLPMELVGEPTADKKGIDWSASSADSQLTISDRIAANEEFSSSVKLMSKADGAEVTSQVENKRLK